MIDHIITRIGPVYSTKRPSMTYHPARGSGRRYVLVYNLNDHININPHQAIFELINTENAYVRDLQLIVEVCEP